MIHQREYPRTYIDGIEVCKGFGGCCCHICELKHWLMLEEIRPSVELEWNRREASRREDERYTRRVNGR